jgi:hypothetical protein
MDVSKSGPLYEAIREHLGLKPDHNHKVIDRRLDAHKGAIEEHEDALRKHVARLRELEISAHDDHPQHDHKAIEERLRAVVARLEALEKPKPKPKAPSKPAVKPRTPAKPRATGKAGK